MVDAIARAWRAGNHRLRRSASGARPSTRADNAARPDTRARLHQCRCFPGVRARCLGCVAAERERYGDPRARWSRRSTRALRSFRHAMDRAYALDLTARRTIRAHRHGAFRRHRERRRRSRTAAAAARHTACARHLRDDYSERGSRSGCAIRS